MDMDYFYVKPEDVTSHGLTLRGDESKHLIRVLRKNIGDRIFVTDGNELMYEAIIAGIGKADTRCTIAAMHHKYNEPTNEVTLAVSLLKNPARFDYLVEKTTELGVRTILPLTCPCLFVLRSSPFVLLLARATDWIVCGTTTPVNTAPRPNYPPARPT